MDHLSAAARSANMSKVRSRDTIPELAVRRAAHRAGLRFRLYRRDLPGSPDLVFSRHRLVVFVHGCFWHRHAGCSRTTTPVSNAPKWQEKFKRNQERDAKAVSDLTALGWQVLIIWECETRDDGDVSSRILREIEGRLNPSISRLDKAAKLFDKDEKRGARSQHDVR